ncbi:MAG: hypothetical protein WBD99_03240 [Thermodesulfobacteriota bacterium]
MRITHKWASVSLITLIVCLLVGLGVFSLWPNSGLKAIGQTNPRVTVLGDPADLPDDMRADLPPGYSSRPTGALW